MERAKGRRRKEHAGLSTSDLDRPGPNQRQITRIRTVEAAGSPGVEDGDVVVQRRRKLHLQLLPLRPLRQLSLPSPCSTFGAGFMRPGTALMERTVPLGTLPLPQHNSRRGLRSEPLRQHRRGRRLKIPTETQKLGDWACGKLQRSSKKMKAKRKRLPQMRQRSQDG